VFSDVIGVNPFPRRLPFLIFTIYVIGVDQLWVALLARSAMAAKKQIPTYCISILYKLT